MFGYPGCVREVLCLDVADGAVVFSGSMGPLAPEDVQRAFRKGLSASATKDPPALGPGRSAAHGPAFQRRVEQSPESVDFEGFCIHLYYDWSFMESELYE